MEKVNTITERGREFFIVKNEQGFWGIESSKFVNGVLTERVNGLQSFLTDSKEKTETMVRQAIEVDFLEASGMDRFDAVLAVVRGDYKKNSGGN